MADGRTSYRQPIIENYNALVAITAARKVKGVHIYIDEPGHEKGKTYQFILEDMARAGVTTLRISAVFLALGDTPRFGVGVGNGSGLSLEMGITADLKKPYGSREDGDWDQQQNWGGKFNIKAGDYGINIGELDFPSKKVKYQYNGLNFPGATDSNFKSDPKEVAKQLYYHLNVYEEVRHLEWHFGYTGITQGMPAAGSNKYISLKDKTMCYMSAGGRAVITGKYKSMEASIDGIAIGLQQTSSNDPDVKVFPEYKDPNQVVTFYIAVGDSTSIVSSPKKREFLEKATAGNATVALVLQNIDIENLEIHTGLLGRPY